MVNISFTSILAQSLSGLIGIVSKFTLNKVLRYKDGFSAERVKRQLPRFISATLFLVGLGNLLMAILALFVPHLLLSKAVVAISTALLGAFIYDYIFK